MLLYKQDYLGKFAVNKMNAFQVLDDNYNMQNNNNNKNNYRKMKIRENEQRNNIRQQNNCFARSCWSS